MATDIPDSFVRQYETEVHEAYQQMGSKLRNTVRTKNGIVGTSTTFQKVGKGTASTKTRHGEVPLMNNDHTPIECTLSDHYAGDYVDKLDELKIQHDERRVIVNAGAFALGRKTDELIITEAVTTTVIEPVGGTGMTKGKATNSLEKLGSADVFEAGGRTYAWVGWKQWIQMLDIPEFKDADFVGQEDLPWKQTGFKGKDWLGTIWMPHTGLLKPATDRQCLWYHETALGHAIGSDVETDIDWEGRKAAHFVNNMMSMGACLIDETGVVRIDCLES